MRISLVVTAACVASVVAAGCVPGESSRRGTRDDASVGPGSEPPVAEPLDAGLGELDSGELGGSDDGGLACAPMDVARDTADDSCVIFVVPSPDPLWRWDGSRCARVFDDGCGCVGADCASAFDDETSCVAAYASCGAMMSVDAGGEADAGRDAGRWPVPMPDAGGTPAGAGCTALALDLISRVNDYRAGRGLPRIPASSSLCRVSAAHTHDLAAYAGDLRAECNLHSWSSNGTWSSCCYTSDHARARCMWDKPREITAYAGNGYENAFYGSNDPAAALRGWQGSPGHNQVILNQGTWADHPWGALGADIHAGYAVLWFGEETDPVR